jgi:hypothetical protein
VERAPWVFRGAWAALPLLAGPAFADALDGASRSVQVVASVGLWFGWVAVLAASLVPRAVTLTVLRLAAPCPFVAAAVAAAVDPGMDDALALGAGVAVAAAASLPAIADAFVDGSSYGAERRFALRTPAALAAGPGLVAWMLAVAAPACAALLLAAEAWIAGGALLLVALVGVRLAVPALHRLSRRWLVFVPAGFVVHDHVALPEPVLLRRSLVRRLGPAPADAVESGALDLTLGASGLVLEAGLTEPVELAKGQVSGRLLVTPLRPGAVLREAATRGYAVATAEPTTSSPS